MPIDPNAIQWDSAPKPVAPAPQATRPPTFIPGQITPTKQASEARANEAAMRAAEAADRAARNEGRAIENQARSIANENRPKAPSGFRFAADGQTLEAIPGGPSDPEAALGGKPTEGQSKSAAFLIRALGSNKSYEGTGLGARNLITQGLQDAAPNITNSTINSESRQIANSAQDEFIAASLRQDSGAAIPEEEMERQRRIYFPMPGDGPDVIEQKKNARLRAIEGLLLSAGPLAEEAQRRFAALEDGEAIPDGTKDPKMIGDLPQGAEVRLGPDMGDEAFNRRSYLLDTYGIDPNKEAVITAFWNANLRNDRMTVEGVKKWYAARDIPAPDDAGIQEAIRAAQEGISFSGIDTNDAKDHYEAKLRNSNLASPLGEAGNIDLAKQGMTLGLTDEASGIGSSIGKLVTGDINMVDNYRFGRDAERLRLEDARQANGAAGFASEFVGGMALPGNALANLAGKGGAIRQGARAGAWGGAAGGFGYGEGAQGTAISTAGGAVAGGVLGGLIPLAGAVARPLGRAANRAAGRDDNVAINQVSKALKEDGITPADAAQTIEGAQSRGVPMVIADVGENSRELLASVARRRGPARTLAQDTSVSRQEGQMERISAAVRRDLGPTANIRELGDELIERARVSSRPLYEKAESNPGAGAVFPKIKDLLDRPSMQGAMNRAKRIATEEGEDPTALGFDLNDQAEVVLTRVPSWKTLDFIKKGMDDVVEQYRDKTTGKLVLDTEGRAINNTLRAFLARVDKANPDYAAARKAYAGPAAMRTALDKGAKALRKSPDDISAEIKDMSDSEIELYRTGVRKAITDMLGTKGDWADKVNALVGTPKSRAALTRVFGGNAKFERFIQTLKDERQVGLTYKAVSTGSPTASRVAFDESTADESLAASAIDLARSAKEGVPGILGRIAERINEAGTLGAGSAGDKAR